MPDEKDRSQSEAIDDAMKKIGLTGGSGGRAKAPADRVMEMFQTALKQGLESRKGAPDAPAGAASGVDNIAEGDAEHDYVEGDGARPAAAAPRKMSEFEIALQHTAREAFNAYIQENVSKDVPAGSEIAVDGVFIRDHGAALVGTMLQALVQTVVPAEIKVDVPAKAAPAAPEPTSAMDSVSADAPAADPSAAPAAAPESQVKLTLDFAKLLGDFVAAARVKAPEAAEDDAAE